MPIDSTYQAIATNTLSSGTYSVTFSSIPSTYTDLVIIGQCGATNTDYLVFRVGNGSVDTASNYSRTYLQGDGTSAATSRNSNQTKIYAGESISIMNNSLNFNFSVHLMNYSNTTTNKTFLSRISNNASFSGSGISAGLWRSTSAINIVTISPDTNDGRTLIAGSTFTLYGIKAA
jgi:hypothetical protein